MILALLVLPPDPVTLRESSGKSLRTLASGNASYQPSSLFVKTWGLLDTYTRARAAAIDAAGNIYLAGSCCDSSQGEGNSRPFLVKFSSSGSLLWQRVWNSTLSPAFGSGVNAMALDSANDIYLAGYQINYTQYVLVLKIDANGGLKWAKVWNGIQDSVATGLALDAAGDVFVSGIADVHNYFSNKILLLRFSATGSLVWQKTWGFQSDNANGITADASGNLYLAGASFRHNGLYNSTFGLLLKFNLTGDFQWGRSWGGDSDVNIANAVAMDPNGSILVTGRAQALSATPRTGLSFMKFNSTGSLIIQRVWPKNAIGDGLTLGSSGRTYVTGEFDDPINNTFARILILKLDPSGDLEWGFAGGSPVQGDSGAGVAVDQSENFIVAGYISQTVPTGWVDASSPLTSFNFAPAPPPGVTSNIFVNATNLMGNLLANIGTLTAGGRTNAFLIKASPPVPSPPDAPGALAAVVNSKNATLSWNTPLSNGGSSISGYHLFKGQRNGSEMLFRNLTSARAYTDTDLRAGMKYYYYVTAFNSAGESSASNRVAVELNGFNVSSIELITVGAAATAIASTLIIFILFRKGYRIRRV